MFPFQNQNQFRNSKADVQFFYGAAENTTSRTTFSYSSWNKPVGVSHVYMMLIGGGAGNSGSSGGGSAAVTVWYGSAQNVPDNLVLLPASIGGPGFGPNNSYVYYRGSSSTLVTLLSANGTLTATGGTAMSANQFAASGFFQSVAGANGSAGALGASSTTFLTGGAGSGSTSNANYGYTNPGGAGYFQLQPIIIGVGGGGTSTTNAGKGGIGSGAGGNSNSNGGQGLIIIASW
jgi:hypothetical protein